MRHINADRILIVKLSSIGDVVMATPAARALRRHMPKAWIAWVVEPKSAGILIGNTDINEIIVWDRRSLRDFLQLPGRLRRQNFDVAIDLQGLARSAYVTLASGARHRIGFADSRELSKFAYNVLATRPSEPAGLCWYLNVLEPLGIACDEGDREMRVVVLPDEASAARTLLEKVGLCHNEAFAALCPATTRDYKHWTEEGWARLADALQQEMGLRSVFLGSGDNVPMINRIISNTSASPINLAGLTSLKEAAAVIEQSRVVVAVDTGLLHVGVALGKPTIGIFGPTEAWRNHADRPHFAMVRKAMDCIPCKKNQMCQEFNCITDVRPDEVLRAVKSLCGASELKGTARC